jgi:hypothetical protein
MLDTQKEQVFELTEKQAYYCLDLVRKEKKIFDSLVVDSVKKNEIEDAKMWAEKSKEAEAVEEALENPKKAPEKPIEF